MRLDRTGGASVSLLDKPMLMALDSTQPNMWLPNSTCVLFEDAFNLHWNDQAERYEVNETSRNNFLAQNVSITFKLGASVVGGSTVNIVLPYSSFDLLASYPLVPINTSSVRYFPLKRATDVTQYTLGRAFLQEVYLVADYERYLYLIAQARWDNPSSNLVAILPPGSSPHPRLGTAAIVGVTLGAVVLVAISSSVFWIFYSRWRQPASEMVSKQQQQPQQGDVDRYSKAELEGNSKPQDVKERVEVDALEQARFQLDADEQAVKPAELHGEAVTAELGEGREVFELPARPE
jgi:hypothetical protein